MTDDRRAQEIVNSYRKAGGLYADLVEVAKTLLEAILAGSGVALYSITGRSKDVESLQTKLARPDRQYDTLEAITDLAGLRIITYFVEDVAAVGGVIEREFAVDRANSVDRGSSLDPDRFGYRSVHYVVQFSPSRRSLPEYNPFAGLRFEIQVRSILQHAWAEIEHDLGYKTRESVPKELRRRFSRLAGLLELADSEFEGIRQSLDKYRVRVAQAVEATESIGIDKDSLLAVLNADSNLDALDTAVAAEMGAALIPSRSLSGGTLVSELSFLGITTTKQLSDLAANRLRLVAPFAKAFLAGKKYKTTERGIGIFYLAYLLGAESGKRETLEGLLTVAGIGADGDRPSIATRVLTIYKSLRDASK